MSVYQNLLKEIGATKVRLIAVSKTQPVAAIESLYQQGQRCFGENKVQELVAKYEALPKDIEWHLIGHLQTNKVKYIAPFVHCIEAVDSEKLLQEINHQAQKNNRHITCLLQVFIAQEEAKFGMNEVALRQLLSQLQQHPLSHIRLGGLMGMATNTTNETQVSKEFACLQQLFLQLKKDFFENDLHFCDLSMGMSNDYKLALANGATMIRIGSKLFGERT